MTIENKPYNPKLYEDLKKGLEEDGQDWLKILTETYGEEEIWDWILSQPLDSPDQQKKDQ